MPSLTDVLVTLAVVALVAAGFVHRPGTGARAHAGALGLERALAQARALASAGDGATLVVSPSAEGGATARVYRSRPIAGAEPVSDAGLAPEAIAGDVRVTSPASTVNAPFAVLLSRAGYASVGALAAPFSSTQGAVFARDPGCSPGATLVVSADGSSEAHALDCNGGAYAAN